MGNPSGMPEYVEYRRYALQGRTIDGAVPLASLSRLMSAVHALPATDTKAQLHLELNEDGQRRVRVAGHVTARVVLQCQRCTTPFEHVIKAPIAGVVVADDAGAAAVPKADEPIMADGDMLDVHALAEDELLLALPIVARCSNTACQTRYNGNTIIAEFGAQVPEQRDDNPFSVLDKIRQDHETD